MISFPAASTVLVPSASACPVAEMQGELLAVRSSTMALAAWLSQLSANRTSSREIWHSHGVSEDYILQGPSTLMTNTGGASQQQQQRQ